jgi:hypothetical protein
MPNEIKGIRCYRIRRYRKNGCGKPRTIRNNVTEAEAQSHCADKDTMGPNWFDGYDYMRGYTSKK